VALIGRIAVALALLAITGTNAAGQRLSLPVVVPGDGVTVRAESGLDGVARRVAADAPDVIDSIYADLPDQKRPDHIEIRLVIRSRDIARAAPPGHGAPPWAAGVAYGDAGVVVVATRREAHSIDVDSTVAHELAHMALDAAVGDRAPRWLHEGFAYLHSSDWSFDRLRTLTGMAWSGDVIPLGELDRRFPAREHEAARAYAQSYDFVVYLARRGRSASTDDDGDPWAFRAFLAGLAEGDPIDQAARRAFRADMQELFSEWYENLRQRYLLVPAGMFTLAVWVLGAILLVVGYIRRRRQNRQRLALWEQEEAARAEPATSGLDDLPHG
jgi:hypothetical protein